MELKFYKPPFTKDKNCSWVYDSEDNFAFQFERTLSKDFKELFFTCINSKEHTPIFKKALSLNGFLEIKLKNEPFILVRGWSNLTVEHKFSENEAIEIQNNLRDWLFWKLQNNI